MDEYWKLYYFTSIERTSQNKGKRKQNGGRGGVPLVLASAARWHRLNLEGSADRTVKDTTFPSLKKWKPYGGSKDNITEDLTVAARYRVLNTTKLTLRRTGRVWR